MNFKGGFYGFNHSLVIVLEQFNIQHAKYLISSNKVICSTILVIYYSSLYIKKDLLNEVFGFL